jgi:hypothetical protein
MVGGGTEEKCFSLQKSQMSFLPNLKYQNIYKRIPFWAKSQQKDTIQLSHMFFATFVTRV